jgi:hypothetical protein
MKCNVWQQLAEAFALAAREYAETVATLGRLTAGLDSTQMIRADEEILCRATEALRKAEEARAAFEAHIGQHQCDEYAASQSVRQASSG